MKWITRLRLVDDVRHAWKWASVRITLLGSSLMAAWLAMPVDVRERMPSWFPLALGLLSIFGRLTTTKVKGAGNGE